MPLNLLKVLLPAAALSLVLPAVLPASAQMDAPGARSEPEPAQRYDADRVFLSREISERGYEAGLFPKHTRSVIRHRTTLRNDRYIWNEAHQTGGTLIIWVDLRRQIISVYRDGHEIGSSFMTYGADNFATPVGRFTILRKDADYHSRTYDAAMPNSLFITADGVALHGASMEPGSATHGCIGLPTGFSRKLFEAANRGDVVEIVRSDGALVDKLSRSSNSETSAADR